MFLFLQYNIINPYLSYCSVNFSVFYVIFSRVLRIRKLSLNKISYYFRMRQIFFDNFEYNWISV